MTSVFPPMPTFPTIRSTPTASWPTVDGTPHVHRFADLPPDQLSTRIQTTPRPGLNKIYFSKKVLNQTLKSYDPNGYADTVKRIWEIPFSVDADESVTELVQKIQAVMTAKTIYRHWDINMNTFIILAIEEATEQDVVRA